ncbi:MAG: hypothetical protein ACI3ZT_11040 [Candidatus Cryptobacteroides sp.]
MRIIKYLCAAGAAIIMLSSSGCEKKADPENTGGPELPVEPSEPEDKPVISYGNTFTATWIFKEATASIWSSSWTGEGSIPSTSGGPASISVVRSESGAGAGKAFSYSVDSNKPVFSTMVQDDYILFKVPVKDLPANSAVQFDMTLSAEPGAPKYYVVEYYDGGEWVAADSRLRTAEEDATVKYSFKCSGLATSSNYQHSTVMRTVRFKNAIKDGEVQIRCRALGKMNCNGGDQSVSASNGSHNFPVFGFTGAHIQDLGNVQPVDTTRILCLGNSFTYFSNAVFYLREIAYSQGHYIDARTHLKGGQTLGQHAGLAMSLDAISEGGYQYAFMQDQSQAAANYAKDKSKYNYVKVDCNSLRNKILYYSPKCRTILENTWAYSASTYGGFSTYDAFYNYLAEGTKAIANELGCWISPIGQAFKAVREDGTGVKMYFSDSKHQSENGSYLKACINYLVLFGQPFDNKASDCGLPSDTASYLRSVAERIVLGNEAGYLISR